ncbi:MULTISPECIES: hypothetical protein [unclassified Chryseobacterium]|uniref:glycosyltransferase family 4 protein n=1 Tax=unclassified Chryseobacterium TaxID=2593645 RepID=UPI00226A4ECE|nr:MULTISPECIES: hypothetical protein [unclassified Chryseobacterium]
MISNKQLINLDSILKKNLKTSISLKDFDKALRLIELSAHLQYNYCFNSTLYDQELEHSLQQIANHLFENVEIIPKDNVVLFYDFFGYDNRGLTQQYLRALKELNKRIVLVFENKKRQYKNEAILAEIENYPNKVIYYLEGNNRIELCESLFKIVETEKPKDILMHLIPWDTIAYMAFYKIKGATRYQVNLTDHTFWLGTDITDVNIEFRSFGMNLSEQLRNIPAHKTRLLPFYPILSTEEFQGFDFDTQGKKIIFSGSTFYKILGHNLEFFETIARLLKLDDNLIFVLAGSGNNSAIIDFINKNELNNRIFLIGDRYDLFEVMKRVDYYISTFPISGSLMTQTAIAAGLPVFTYVSSNSLYNEIENLFSKSETFESTNSLDELVEKFSIEHKKGSQRNSQGRESMLSEEEFAQILGKILEGENPMSFLEKRVSIQESYQHFNELMIETENLYNPIFDNTINKYLPAKERLKLIPNYRRNYYKKVFKENKIQFLKELYYYLIKGE